MIYSVEDDQAIRDLLLYTLRQAGYEAEGFADGKEFQEAMRRRLPRLVLMDQMLPGVDGERLLIQMRRDERTRHIPVIMLTAKDSEMDKVRSLDDGADDYIVKPFGVMELLSASARCCAGARKSRSTSGCPSAPRHGCGAPGGEGG